LRPFHVCFRGQIVFSWPRPDPQCLKQVSAGGAHDLANQSFRLFALEQLVVSEIYARDFCFAGIEPIKEGTRYFAKLSLPRQGQASGKRGQGK